MATIKAIEAGSKHHIQSGQVIVDLISVVKELLENSLDAGATSIDVRLKNNGLDSIEVQDNGNGIAPQDFESIALKHHTSKLSSFEDLDSLETFGFRGEALSSLTALSNLLIVTARAQDGAVGKRLEFEPTGRLKSTSVVAAQKGTTVSVENLFHGLPVRRKELEKNIKREYGKVLNFLQSYACICIGIRISVSNQMPKGKKVIAISTKGNPTTRENIANVFGAKTLNALIKVDLTLTMEPDIGPTTQSARNWSTQSANESHPIRVVGHISKPSWGEGRPTPDRQMFFVNSRPCILPQIAKVFNEVYKTFNHHQSPFILANLQMKTNTYDVNVSPDKKTIMLHDQTALLEALKAELSMLFENIDRTLPQSQIPAKSMPAYKPLSIVRSAMATSPADGPGNLVDEWASRGTSHRSALKKEKASSAKVIQPGLMSNISEKVLRDEASEASSPDCDEDKAVPSEHSSEKSMTIARRATEMDLPSARIAAEQAVLGKSFVRPSPDAPEDEAALPHPADAQAVPQAHGTAQQVSQIAALCTNTAASKDGPVADAFAHMRSGRVASESADITIGDASTGSGVSWNKRRKLNVIKRGTPSTGPDGLSTALTQFAAPGSQMLLSFDSSHFKTPQIAREPSVEGDDPLFTAGDGTPELPLEQGSFDDEQSTNVNEDDLAKSTHPDEAGESAGREAEAQDDSAIVSQLVHNAEHIRHAAETGSRGVFATQSVPSRRDATYSLTARLSTSIDQIRQASVMGSSRSAGVNSASRSDSVTSEELDAESKLSLTVSKTDFDRMQVVGQFNLGFILASRPGLSKTEQDELFIIDQHAADEKYNYERLQRTVELQGQRLVRPISLELSAIEREVVLNHHEALRANGFEIETIDADGDGGQVFQLLTLPMSNHKTFQLSDLEELLHLLSELPSGSSEVPRPRKVQRMLAMRACRSSIMVGKTLTHKQMLKVVRNMGGMDKPWNCPHGRPTMRHLYKLDQWQGWHESDDGQYDERNDSMIREHGRALWKDWLRTEAEH